MNTNNSKSRTKNPKNLLINSMVAVVLSEQQFNDLTNHASCQACPMCCEAHICARFVLEFPDVEKLGLGFRELFFVFVQIRFLKIDALTEDFHTIFCSKNFYILHFFSFCNGKNFQMWKIGPCFSRTFFALSCKSCF
jgi:hypothetical protein